MTNWKVPSGVSQDTLSEIATKVSGRKAGLQLQPIEAAAVAYARYGLARALDEASAEADRSGTSWHHAVVAVLEAAYENDPPNPNDCPECARSYGPLYDGPCEH